MSYFAWTPDLLLGIDVIDVQHKRIVDYINELHIAIQENNNEGVVHIAEKVVDYTHEHFAYEEALLKKADYLLTEPHILSHRRFKENALKMKDSVINNDKDMRAAKKMRSTLTLWLTEHIKNEDAKYVHHIDHLFKQPEQNQKKHFLSGIYNFFKTD